MEEKYLARLIKMLWAKDKYPDVSGLIANCDPAWRHAAEKLSKLLGTPDSRISHSAAGNGEREGAKMVRIGQSAAKSRRHTRETFRDYNGSFSHIHQIEKMV